MNKRFILLYRSCYFFLSFFILQVNCNFLFFLNTKMKQNPELRWNRHFSDDWKHSWASIYYLFIHSETAVEAETEIHEKNNEIFSELFCFLSFYDTFSFHLHISIYWLRFIAANTHFFSYYFRARVFLRIFSFRPMQKFEQDHDDQYFNTARTNCCCVEIGDESFLC